jgi:MarR family protein
MVTSWTFLTNHARVLLCVAHDPGVRLRDIAASLDITERSAFGIITDLVEAGYVIKEKDGRRNRYHIQAHLPLSEPASREPASREPASRERTIGEVLALLVGAGPAANSAFRPTDVQGADTGSQ